MLWETSTGQARGNFFPPTSTTRGDQARHHCCSRIKDSSKPLSSRAPFSRADRSGVLLILAFRQRLKLEKNTCRSGGRICHHNWQMFSEGDITKLVLLIDSLQIYTEVQGLKSKHSRLFNKQIMPRIFISIDHP